jgi:BirA family biotin operon repressor/biotin-[acetyl-CoA-carboxylase] ligase
VSLVLDGLDAVALASYVGAPIVELHESVNSTMDEAHRLGEGSAPTGTVVVALRQLAGRGRHGRRWTSQTGDGLWMTALHRNVPSSGLDVLSVRIGLELAPRLEAMADGRVRLKWPNDLLVGTGKLAGILVETRWRDGRVEWVAVGVGINVAPPADQPGAVGLRRGVMLRDVMREAVPAISAACAATGDLSGVEMNAYAARDSARDAHLIEPMPGFARGITVDGALIVETSDGRKLFRRGSLVRAPGDA